MGEAMTRTNKTVGSVIEDVERFEDGTPSSSGQRVYAKKARVESAAAPASSSSSGSDESISGQGLAGMERGLTEMWSLMSTYLKLQMAKMIRQGESISEMPAGSLSSTNLCADDDWEVYIGVGVVDVGLVAVCLVLQSLSQLASC